MTHKRMLEVDIEVDIDKFAKTSVDCWAAVHVLEVLRAAIGDETNSDLPVVGVVDHCLSILRPVAAELTEYLHEFSTGGKYGDA